MIEIFLAEEFQKRYRDLPTSIQRKTEKQEKTFRKNPYHPSLHTEKLRPKKKEVWAGVSVLIKDTELFFASLMGTRRFF